MSTAAVPDLFSWREPAPAQPRQPAARSLPTPWNRSALAGRLVELSSWGPSTALTMAFSLVRDAQQEGEPVAWVTPAGTAFYPPDAADGGVDLEALVVVRVPSAAEVARAADRLLRSGAFGLVVMDLGERAEIPVPLQARLVGLAQKHGTVLLGLTVKRADAPSLGALASLRVEAQEERVGRDRFRCSLQALKDKRHAPGWVHAEVCHGPPGLR